MPANPARGHVPYYEFAMRRPGGKQTMGIGSTAKLRYAGHIGYRVKPRYRGHRYAARSCRLSLPLTIAHSLRQVWLTVDSKNIPS